MTSPPSCTRQATQYDTRTERRGRHVTKADMLDCVLSRWRVVVILVSHYLNASASPRRHRESRALLYAGKPNFTSGLDTQSTAVKKKKEKRKGKKTIVLARRNVRLQNCMSEKPVLFVVSRLVQKKIHNQGTRPTGDLRPRLRKSSIFTEIPVPCLFCQATSTSLAPVIPLLKSSTRSGRLYRQVLHCSLALKS